MVMAQDSSRVNIMRVIQGLIVHRHWRVYVAHGARLGVPLHLLMGWQQLWQCVGCVKY